MAQHEAEKQGLVKKSKKRNLKDKERVLYAPYTNIGSMNFEKTTGYINIPDSNVVFTRIDEDDNAGYGDGLGGVDPQMKDLNEGQKMVFNLQDADRNNTILNDANIEQPLLMAGVSIDNTGKSEIKEITAKIMENTDENALWDEDNKNDAEDSGLVLKGKNEKDIQNMFKESQVDTIQNLIYGK